MFNDLSKAKTFFENEMQNAEEAEQLHYALAIDAISVILSVVKQFEVYADDGEDNENV